MGGEGGCRLDGVEEINVAKRSQTNLPLAKKKKIPIYSYASSCEISYSLRKFAIRQILLNGDHMPIWNGLSVGHERKIENKADGNREVHLRI